MKIHFGLEFEEVVFLPEKIEETKGVFVLGKLGILSLLEKFAGLEASSGNQDFLRIEQFRQAIQAELTDNPESFYKTSFEADGLATAAKLLQMRDTLLISGFDFESNLQGLPNRIKEIQGLHEKTRNNLGTGYADRVYAILQSGNEIKFPIEEIFINEPEHLLPIDIKRIFRFLKSKGVKISFAVDNIPEGKSDLLRFTAKIMEPTSGKTEKIPLSADGSLVIIRSKRETEAAEFIAKLIRNNPDFKPLCLIPEKNRALDNAIIQEGIPSLGILSSSLGRPSLQILRLITAFLWDPIDPYKIIEFLSLATKPLHQDLASVLARLMSATPGIGSDRWDFEVSLFFRELRQLADEDSSIDYGRIRFEYEFWFNRRRYDVESGIPVREVIEVFEELQSWARKTYDELPGKVSSFMVLSQQAKRITELLHALPDSEKNLSFLRLERIVRTVYEPAPVVFREEEMGHLPFIYHNSAIIGNPESMLWWNFTDHDRDYFFSEWYPKEVEFLHGNGIEIPTPSLKNKLAIWQRNIPFVRTANRMVLVIPERVNGQAVQPHSLEGDLKATFGDLSPISFEVETENGKEFLEKHFTYSQRVSIEHQKIGLPKPFINVNIADKLTQGEEETFTGLDSLFYYPYKYVFKHKLGLKKSPILSVVKDHTLMGNLAHRFFELMFRQEEVTRWTRGKVEHWIEERSKHLLGREGAVLLMYGKEPERAAFLRKVKNASWVLLDMIRRDGWSIKETEMNLKGDFRGKVIKGKADLVLERNDEQAVIDFKWGGKTRRKNIIRSREDLQLVMYSKLLSQNDSWAHTAYFIISEAEMITRNQKAFTSSTAVEPDVDHVQINQEIWQKMEKTFDWRMQQFKEGKIEVRTKHTLDQLEEIYFGQLVDLLEMKQEDSPYDNYSTLVNLID